MLSDKVIKKVPGIIAENPNEKQGHIEDLSKLSQDSLIELLRRQEKLLANRNFIARLKDGGEKIIKFRIRIKDELEKREIKEREKSCEPVVGLTEMLSTLRLEAVELSKNIEWNAPIKNISETSIPMLEKSTNENQKSEGTALNRFAPWRLPKSEMKSVVTVPLSESLVLECSRVTSAKQAQLMHSAARHAGKSEKPATTDNYREPKEHCASDHENSDSEEYHSYSE